MVTVDGLAVFCTVMPPVHIGTKIKERAEELKMRPTDLANRINTSKQNLYGIFKRQSIDSELLSEISRVLDYDFFQYYQHSSGHKPNVLDPESDVYSDIAGLKAENKLLRAEVNALKEKFDMLKEIVDLIKQKK